MIFKWPPSLKQFKHIHNETCELQTLQRLVSFQLCSMGLAQNLLWDSIIISKFNVKIMRNRNQKNSINQYSGTISCLSRLITELATQTVSLPKAHMHIGEN